MSESTELSAALSRLAEHLPHYQRTSDAEEANDSAEAVANAVDVLLSVLTPRAGLNEEHPNRIEVTIHGLDVYVERRDDCTEVSFGTDELPERYPLVVEQEGAAASLVGRTVLCLEWDRGEHGCEIYIRASVRGAEQLRDELVRQNWHKMTQYDWTPEEPPTDAQEALAVWETAQRKHADPDVGMFVISSANIGT
ncbi:hypothetical protein AB0B10_25735 [Micromonospora arborensis]|uniref:hypothetical protein n=1 Tax=Micromonospora arborensis TaxID=2116518 RepID=UPI0033CBD744